MEFKIFDFGNYENYKNACAWLKEKGITFFKHSQVISILLFYDDLDYLNADELDYFYDEILE